MPNILKIALAPYFVLGMVMAVACSPCSAWHPGFTGFAVIGAIHILFTIGAPYLVADAKRKGLAYRRLDWEWGWLWRTSLDS